MLHIFRQPRQFYRELLHLALPIALQNLINYSLALADTMMLGAVGQNEIAGASVVNSSFFVIMLMVFGFQSGASVLISQYYGKGDHKTVSRVMGISFFAAFTRHRGLSPAEIDQVQDMIDRYREEHAHD